MSGYAACGGGGRLLLLPLVRYDQTLTEKSGELDKIKNDARLRYILGEIDDAGWKKEIDKWMKAGGEKGMEELNAEYAKLKK
ncbi:Lipoprotein LipO precursor [compost metagenome]